jgi:O-acetyl-ADP-ribose deacetylase (regulator of RNase III)
MNRVQLILGDITEIVVDAIVNAANTSLLGGGGVDGAIHRAAGPELLKECRRLGVCPTGEARITKAYRLPAKYVIHTVGPVWRGGKNREAELLASCYKNSLKLAEQVGVKSIAFPSISTGAYKFPIASASKIAVQTVRDYLKTANTIKRVVFVCYSRSDYETYQKSIQSVKTYS